MLCIFSVPCHHLTHGNNSSSYLVELLKRFNNYLTLVMLNMQGSFDIVEKSNVFSKNATDHLNTILLAFSWFSWHLGKNPSVSRTKCLSWREHNKTPEKVMSLGVRKSWIAPRNSLLFSQSSLMHTGSVPSPTGFVLVIFLSVSASSSLVENHFQRDRMFSYSCDVSDIKVID